MLLLLFLLYKILLLNKPSEPDGAFSTVSSFRSETVIYSRVLCRTSSHAFSVITKEGFSFFSPFILVAGLELFVYGLASEKTMFNNK